MVEKAESRPAPAAQIGGLLFALLLVDPNGRVAEANPAAENMLGRSAKRLINQPIGLALNVNDLRVTRRLETGEGALVAREIEIRTAEGGKRVNLTMSPLASHQGWRVITLSETSRDEPARDGQNEMSNLGAPSILAHEIKNPLASLRSAVGTLRLVKRDDQREKLLDVIEHDVRRLDRLVSDISNASRLDSELVKEEQETFDLLKMLGNLGEYLGKQAKDQGIDFITDLPKDPILVNGLEARLAQVFVNLITNAISFCEDGDAIRVWARRRENRVLVVVEDTGPGIPEQALTKVFKRFYSERPAGQYGNNSGLGLSISKQIVEAHGGVIWAENIRPTDADISSDPLGARFVVGLPI